MVLSLSLLASGPAWAGTVTLTADETARRLLEVSPAAAAATERARAATSTARAADSALFPTLVVTANVSERSSVPEFRLPVPLQGSEPPVLNPDITETYGAAIRAQQALYAGGAISAQRRAVRHDEAALVAQRDLAVLDLRLLGKLAYWDAVRSRAILEAARVQETRARRLVSDVDATFQAGLSVKADVLAARERAARARTQVVRAEAAAANALAQLRSLLSLPREDEIALDGFPASALPAAPAALSALQTEAFTRRPESQVVEAQRAALRERAALAAAPGRPSVLLSAQYDYARPNLRYFPQADAWRGSWAIGLGASFTAFDGGKWRAEVAAAHARERAAGLELEELRRRVALEVETSARDLSSALEAVLSTAAAHATAVESERAAQERREAGLATILELLDAQSQLANAEQETIQARVTAWMAAARLDRAAGR